MGEQPEIGVPQHTAANLRRSMIIAFPVGGALLVTLSLIGRPIAGAFVLVGLLIGALNIYLVQRSVVGYAKREGPARKKRFVVEALGRLGAITALAALAYLVADVDGLGLLGGVALFQLLMLANATVPLFKELRKA